VILPPLEDPADELPDPDEQAVAARPATRATARSFTGRDTRRAPVVGRGRTPRVVVDPSEASMPVPFGESDG
jgi:hypothetical protein